MLEYNKNYATLFLNYMLKNSKGIILALEIERRYENKTIKTYKILQRVFVNVKEQRQKEY